MTKRNEPCPCGSNMKYKKCCGTPEKVESASSESQQRQTNEAAEPSSIREQSEISNPVGGKTPGKPESAQDYYMLGCNYYEKNMLEDAVRCFKDALFIQPAPEVYFNLAVVQEKLGSLKDAIESYKEALRLKPELKMVYVPLGNLYQQTGDVHKAIECYETALSVDQNNAETYNNLGVALKKTNKLEDAAVNFKKALQLRENYHEAYTNLGTVLSELGRIDEAIDCYQHALAIHPMFLEANINFGIILKNLGRFDEAADCFLKSLSVEPNKANVLYDLGVVYLSQRRFDGAVDCFLKSLDIDQNFTKSLGNLGLIYFEQRRYEEAADYYLKSLSIDPNSSVALDNLGLIYLKQRKYEEAVSCFNKALSVDPEYYRAIYSLGLASQKQGRYKEAGELFLKVLKKNPEYAEAYYGLGIINNGEGGVEEAIAYFNKAIEFSSSSSRFHTYLVIIYWINGDWEACKNHHEYLSAHKFGSGDSDFAAPYHSFLGELLKYRAENAAKYIRDEYLPTLYVLGDSHSLSLANTLVNMNGNEYISEALTVIGCKAWHLGNKENNSYKYEFAKRVESIPPGSTAVLMFGEIDCRIQDGIIKNYKINHGNLTESIITLVDNYLDYVLKKFATLNIRPIICTIPKTEVMNLNFSDADENLYDEVLSIFNQALKDHARNKQIPILDAYAYSIIQEKSPDNKFRLDGVHLLPSVYGDLIKKLSFS
ncbi:MAG: tetratricopeptide repeat protein [Proteobacteria bacterium]|nr:tetratricopeptide repeat protein [Pseudomonadota bacterium]MBU1688500.1 tetratricopeptide repeat protein [Pseudomonadota bacterium]